MKAMLVAAIAATLLAFAPGSATGASGNDVAKGHGTTTFGDSFAFSATANFNDTGAHGSVRLDTALGAQEVTFYGDVTCLRVVGNTASIAGNVTNISPPIAFYGNIKSFVVQATDGGKFGSVADTVYYGLLTTPAPPDGACPAPSPANVPISTGDIVIGDAIS
jgi:hypothetical protein